MQPVPQWNVQILGVSVVTEHRADLELDFLYKIFHNHKVMFFALVVDIPQRNVQIFGVPVVTQRCDLELDLVQPD